MVVDHGKNTVIALHKCGAALHPIAAVVIADVAEFADGCAMDVATEHSVYIVTLRIMRHSS